jgi:hypothetical protein
VSQAAISAPSRATRTAPTLRARFGLKEAARRAVSILALGAARWLVHVDLDSSRNVRRGPAASLSASTSRRTASHRRSSPTRPTAAEAGLLRAIGLWHAPLRPEPALQCRRDEGRRFQRMRFRVIVVWRSQ